MTANDLDPEQRYPVELVLPDLPLVGPPLPVNATIDFALVLCRITGEDGQDLGWSYRTTESPDLVELLGALDIQIQSARRRGGERAARA